MKRVDLKVWFACNNHCKFCVQGNKRLKYKQRTLEEIINILKFEYLNWCRSVVFTWWEPTIHKDILLCIKQAKALWYSQIQIQSNWRAFSNYNFLIELIEAGITEFSPAIHWFRPETHDFLVGCKGAWQEVIDWLINLIKLNQIVLVNVVITSDNYKELPQLALLLCRLWVYKYQFAYVHILGNADINKDAVVPKKTDIMPYLKKGLDIWNKHWILCSTEAIPYCLMKWYEWHITENKTLLTTVVDAECRTENYVDYRLYQWKTKRYECKSCRYFKKCEWPWKEYPQIYWWNEFVPVINE